MRKLLIAFMLLVGTSAANAQTYRSLNIVPSENVTINSKDGIVVQNITVNNDKTITVTLYNSNHNRDNERNSYIFEWYLSYKGKRVSDYFTEVIRCKNTANRTVYIWPGEVPAGYEKYVTVQLGREPKKKDPRDDD